MKGGVMAWLRFFRIVNLPTVPGDVLVGASSVLIAGSAARLTPVFGAVLAALFAYLFGLADNDITGAATDRGRPIPDGEISLAAARVARALCWAAVPALGLACRLPREWWIVMLLLLTAIVAYNRTKNAWLMGLCRGLDVAAGAAAAGLAVPGASLRMWFAPLAFALVWTLYIGAVTRYSEGEEDDPVRKGTVGALIGALIYLQLGSLVVLALLHPRIAAFRAILLTGAAMLVLLRLLRGLFPKVSAS